MVSPAIQRGPTTPPDGYLPVLRYSSAANKCADASTQNTFLDRFVTALILLRVSMCGDYTTPGGGKAMEINPFPLILIFHFH